MHMGFDTEVAAAVGLNGAVILDNLAYWIRTNEANERNYYDGRYWTYNTAKAYEKLFPYWTARTIRYTLSKLEHDGYILIREYNKDKMNHTKWYTITDEGWELFPKRNELPDDDAENDADDVTKMADKSDNIEVANLENRSDKKDFPSNYTNSNYTGSNKGTRAGARAKDTPAAHPSSRPSTRIICPLIDPPKELADAWDGFVEMRKKLKKPLTQRAADLIANKLEKLAPGNDLMKADILNQSVERGWQGVFPLKFDAESTEVYRDAAPKRGTRYREPTAKELYQQAKAIMDGGETS